MGNYTIRALLFANDLAIGSFIINGVQKRTDQTVRYCNKVNLKCNLNKSKVMTNLIIKGGKLTKSEFWYRKGPKTGKLKKVTIFCHVSRYIAPISWKLSLRASKHNTIL